MENLKPINIFDFDGTLTTETWPKFWVWIKKFGYMGESRNDKLENAIAEYKSTHEGSDLENFFGFFNDLLYTNSGVILDEELMAGEQYIKYNPGVLDFIKETTVTNYIVSGGLKRFLDGLEIAKYFDGIYGTPTKINEKNEVYAIGEVMTDEKKLLAIQDILKINNRTDCRNVYYLGDGSTDAAAMRYVHNNGGKAIFVYQPNKDDKFYEDNQRIYRELNKDGMVDFCCEADYTKGSELSKILER